MTTTDIKQEKVDLYYAEVIGNPIPQKLATARMTDELKCFTGTADEVTDYIKRFDWSRSFWRTQQVAA